MKERRRWTPQEDGNLLANADRFSSSELADLLGRTVYSVDCRLWALRGGRPVSKRPIREALRKPMKIWENPPQTSYEDRFASRMMELSSKLRA